MKLHGMGQDVNFQELKTLMQENTAMYKLLDVIEPKDMDLYELLS